MEGFIIKVLFLIPIPSLMILFGWIWRKYPPKKINWIYGYRTKRSMKDENSWVFAQNYLSKVWLSLGLVLFFVSILISLILKIKKLDIPNWIYYGELFILLFSLVIVELKLREEFD